MNETIKTLMQRRSIRRYTAEPVSEEAMNAILEAGVYAPSAMGKQSVVLVAVEDKETLDTLRRINGEIWGKDIDPFYGAPAAVVVLADPEASGELNAGWDGALAMGNMMNAAAALGLGSCWINRARETFDRPDGKALLRKWGLKETLIGVGNCALGHADGDAPAPAPRRDGRVVRV